MGFTKVRDRLLLAVEIMDLCVAKGPGIRFGHLLRVFLGDGAMNGGLGTRCVVVVARDRKFQLTAWSTGDFRQLPRPIRRFSDGIAVMAEYTRSVRAPRPTPR